MGGEKYWNEVDARLQFIRTRAESSASKAAKCVIISWFFFADNSLTFYAGHSVKS